MPGESFVIHVTMTGVPQTEAGAKRVGTAAQGMEASVSKASAAGAAGAKTLAQKWTGAGAAMTAAGKKLNRNVTLPIVAIGAVSGKMAVDFEKSMRNVNSIAQLPEPTFQRLNQQVLNLAGPTAQAPKTLADGLYDLVSSGFDAGESVQILEASARAATAGLTTTEVSTKAVAAALNAYQRPAGDARQVSDDLFQTVNLGVVSFDELASSIGYVLPAAATMKVDLKEVGASISTLTKQGQSGSNAVTNINAALTAFIKPSKDMKAVLKELGYETSLQLIQQKGFQGALELVTDAVGGNREAIGKLFPNVRAMRAVFGLTGDAVGSARQDLRGFQNDSGATAKVLREQSKSIAFQWNQLKAEGAKLGIELGNKLIPVMRDLAGDVVGIFRAFGRLPEGVQTSTLKLLALGAVMGPVLRVGGALVTTVGKLTKGMQILAATDLAAGLAQALRGDTAILRILGGDLAGKLLGGLAKAIPIAAAGAGVVNILSSVIGGDGEQALFKTGGAMGGALVGGIIGSVVPGIGTAIGAMVGGGAGSFLGGFLGDLFDSGKKVTPIQERLADSARSVAAAFKTQREASAALAKSSHGVERAHNRERAATREVRQAQSALNEVRKKSGPNSNAVIQAEVRLARAKRQSAKASREERNAERLHGEELKAGKELMRVAVLEERHRINVLKQSRKGIIDQRKALKDQGATVQELRPVNEHLLRNSRELRQAQGKYSQTLLDASRQVGPKFARFLRQASGSAVELGRNVKHSLKDITDPLHGTIFDTNAFATTTVRANKEARGGYERTKAVLGPFRDQTNRQLGKATGDARNFATGTKQAFGEVEAQTNRTLTALGVKQVNFSISGGGGNGGKRKARGGIMRIPGAGKQDTVPLNVMGAPVMAAPGEDIAFITEHQRADLDFAVKSIYGDSNLVDFFGRQNRPHYMARGGIMEPRLTGTHPMRTIGQADIRAVTKAARAYIRRAGGDKTWKSVVNEGNRMDGLRQPYLWGGGHGSTPSRNGPWDCSGGISQLLYGAGWKDITPMVSSGFESWGEAGKGRVSVLANPEHVYAVVDGKGAIGTSGENPGGGFGWITSYTYRPGFTTRHADLMGEGSPTSPRRGRGQRPAKGFAQGGFVSTSYGPPWEGINGSGTTATGVDLTGSPHRFLVAVDPSVLSLHSKLYIHPNPFQTREAFEAEDTGSAIKGKRIDFYDWRGRDSQLGWGRRTVTVETAGAGGGGAKSVPKQSEFAFGPGTSTAGGTAAPGRGSVPTAKLDDFGSLPDTLPKVRKELGERRNQLAQYRRAYQIQKDPQERAALMVNIRLIAARIQALLKQQARLVRERQRKKITERIAKRGTFPNVETLLGTDEASYNRAVEYAGQVVDLEPETLSPDYVNTERGAFGSELEIERVWRNHLIGAQGTADERTKRLNEQLKRIEDLRTMAPTKQIPNPKAAYQQQKYRIKPLRDALAAVASTRADWTSKLGDVQGLSGPGGFVAVLPAEPMAGSYGGYIFETQKSLRDLDLRLKQTGGGGDSELDQLRLQKLEEENRVLRQERFIERAQAPVLADYLGHYEKGGILPRDGYYYGHEGEEVIPKDQRGGGVTVLQPHIHVSDELAPYITATVERRWDDAGRAVGLSRGTPSAPGRRAIMRQGRRR